MANYLSRCLLLATLVLAWALTGCNSRSKETRVLIFTKTAGFRHGCIPTGREALMKLCAGKNMVADTTQDSRYFNDANLAKYSAVIFLCTSGNVLNNSQQAALMRYIEAGGGFVGIHSASDTEQEWPWYRDNLVGMWFKDHPKPANATLLKTSQSHPATEHFPASFQRFDEWYNFRDSLAPEFKVLLTIDPKSYEGSKMGKVHPMSWCRQLEHGRSFYTALGHTEESYAEEGFLKHVAGGLTWAIGDNRRDYDRATTPVPPDESRFTKTILDFNLNEPGELAVTPTGSVLYIQRKGEVKYWNAETGKARTIATLNVATKYEDGVLGVVCDPNFTKNRWIYLYYSPAEGEHRNQLSRFTFDGDTIFDEKVMLQIPTQRQECCHTGGSLVFDAQGNLWLSTGDNTNPFKSTGYAPIDERADRGPFDAQKSSSNAGDLRGKILRIKPTPDGGYTVPAGNLFPRHGKAGRPEIYVMGCRNPYRISVDSRRNIVYWGDVGPDAGKDSTLGPKGHDEFNMAATPGFYGWPYFVADNQPYAHFNFVDSSVGAKFNANHPLNQSPNNTGPQGLPPARPALLYYPYDYSPKFPELGKGGRCAMAGPVYHYDPQLASNVKLPRYYDGAVIAYDWMRDWFFAVWTDGRESITRKEPIFSGVDLHRVIDMELAPDGSLFMLEYGDVWFSENENARLIKLEYNHDNRAPIAKASANVTAGQLPLQVQFSSQGSFDPDYGDSLRYEWRIEGGRVNKTQANPSYTFKTPGQYLVTLIVTDGSGRRNASQVLVRAGNAMPELTLANTLNTSFFWPDQAFNYRFEVTDKEDGSTQAGTIDRNRVLVTKAWVPQGFDMTLAAQGHQQNLASEHPGAVLMAGSDCKACHQKEKRSVGPAYVEIARRYAGKAKEHERLAKKIISGGAGNWGDHGMSAHPQLSLQQTRTMVDYILSLSAGAEAGAPMPAQGSVKLAAQGESGAWALTATYADRGARGIGPNKVTRTWVLRNARLQGEDAVFNEGAPKKAKDPQQVKYANTWKKGSWLLYKDIDMSSIGGLKMRYGCELGTATASIRLDAPDGPEIGRYAFDSTGGQEVFTESKLIPLQASTGVHNFYVVIDIANHTKGKKPPSIDWLYMVPGKGQPAVARQAASPR